MPSLAALDRGRDNNFNLLRAIAALAVIYSHAFALSGKAELIGGVVSLGTLGVRTFFVLSGFLITKSFLSRQSLKYFLLARFFRIYPGAWVSVLICALVFGPYFTGLSLDAYWHHPAVRTFLWKNFTLLGGVQGTLPQAFPGNVYPVSMNASLWTLQYELILYLITGLLGVLAILQDKKRYAIVLGLTLLGYIFFKTTGFVNLTAFLKGSGLRTDRWLDLSMLFLTGGAFAVFKSRIPMTWPFAALSFVAVFASYRWGWRDWVLPISFTYAVLALAFLPKGFFRKFNHLGDYSYGLYIYSFPVQQALIVLYLRHQQGPILLKNVTPDWEVTPFFFVSSAVTLVFAILSWHLVEKPGMLLFQKLTTDKSDGSTVERRW